MAQLTRMDALGRLEAAIKYSYLSSPYGCLFQVHVPKHKTHWVLLSVECSLQCLSNQYHMSLLLFVGDPKYLSDGAATASVGGMDGWGAEWINSIGRSALRHRRRFDWQLDWVTEGATDDACRSLLRLPSAAAVGPSGPLSLGCPSVRQIDHSAVDTPSSRGRRKEQGGRTMCRQPRQPSSGWRPGNSFGRRRRRLCLLPAPLYCHPDPKFYGHFFNASNATI